jgi:hypothetical protein
MTITKYRGKYPHQIKGVSAQRRGVTILTTNDGMSVQLDTKELAEFTGGALPQLGEDIRPYLAIARSLD